MHPNQSSGRLVVRRREQRRKSIWNYVSDALLTQLKNDDSLRDIIVLLERDVEENKSSAGLAADHLVQSFRQ